MGTHEFKEVEEEIIKKLENPRGKDVPIEFIEKSEKDEEAAKLKGTLTFKAVTYIKKYVSRLSIIEKLATETDFQQYPRQYDAYLKKQTQKEDGIPLGMLPGITKVDIDNLEAHRVFTIERLANAPAIVLTDIGPGCHKLQQRALAYLQQSSTAVMELKAKDQVIGEKDQALSEKDQTIEDLKKQIQEMEKKNEPSNNGPKRGKRVAPVRASVDDNREQQ